MTLLWLFSRVTFIFAISSRRLIFNFYSRISSRFFLKLKTDGKAAFRTLSLKKGNEERTWRVQNLNPLVLSEKTENGFDLISDGCVCTPSSEDSFCLAVRIVLCCSIGVKCKRQVCRASIPLSPYLSSGKQPRSEAERERVT